VRNRLIAAGAILPIALSAGAVGTAVHAQAANDAVVPGTNFHATGTIRCVRSTTGPALQCEFGVIRIGNGSATVTIRKPDGTSRTIVYRQGAPVGYDQDLRRPVPMKWHRRGDETTVQIARETYVIPDAAIFGG